MDEMDIQCTKEDKIKCTLCGNISLVKDLKMEKGHMLTGENGAFQQTIYYYCNNCDDKYAKVFDWGNSNLTLSCNVELILETA